MSYDELLPAHVGADEVGHLVDALAGEIQANPAIQDALHQCNLEPTSRPVWLAALAAVNVLLAHEIGQEGKGDEDDDGDEDDEPDGNDGPRFGVRSVPGTTSWCVIDLHQVQPGTERSYRIITNGDESDMRQMAAVLNGQA